MNRRQFNFAMAGLACSIGTVRANTLKGPVKMVVPFSAGGGTDSAARIIAAAFSDASQLVSVVENRPGAGTKIAYDAVINARPDGQTLFFTGLSSLLAPHMTKISMNLLDMVPVAQTGIFPWALVVRKGLPITNVRDLIDYGLANPGKLNYGSPSGQGGTSHLLLEMFQAATGIKAQHIPYKGGAQAMVDLLAGRVDFMVDTFGGVAGHLQQGKLRLLAVTTAQRSSLSPETPTIAETVPGFELTSWAGFFAPPGTPADVAILLSEKMMLTMQQPQTQQRLRELGVDPVAAPYAPFGRLLQEQEVRYGALIKHLGLEHAF